MDEYVLLDTNVWSILVKKDSRAALFKNALSGKRLSVSFITVAEVYKWQFSRRWSEAKSRQMSAALRRYVVVPYQERIAEFWGKIASATDSIGKRMGDNDCWLAAIAAAYRIPFATANVEHFRPAEELGFISLILPESSGE
jgi:predicted nucleic acid-binding protein